MNVISAVVAKNRNKIAAAKANKKRFEVWSRSTTGDDRRLGRGWGEDLRTNADPGLFSHLFSTPSRLPVWFLQSFQHAPASGHHAALLPRLPRHGPPVVLLLALSSLAECLPQLLCLH